MRDFGQGVRFVMRGFGYWGRRPKAMFLGLIPAVIVAVVLLTAFVFLAINIADISQWLTGFTTEWPEWLQTTSQIAAGIVVLGGAAWLSILCFTALTLAVGDPFYEAIASAVEQDCGAGPAPEQGFMRSLGRSIADGLRTLAVSLLIGIGLFAIGCIPFAGPVIDLVLGTLVAGWFLTIALTAYAFNRRGLRYGEYRKILAKRRGLALGFGTCVFLLFLIPLGAVIATPAVVAGATLMAREVLGETSAPIRR